MNIAAPENGMRSPNTDTIEIGSSVMLSCTYGYSLGNVGGTTGTDTATCQEDDDGTLRLNPDNSVVVCGK